MKKLFTFVITVTLLLNVLSVAACADDHPLRIAGLKGPTTMGLVKLIEDNENGLSKNSYDFTLAGSADEITPKLIRGELDLASVPANLAAVLYNNTKGAIQVLAVNTLGVLYIVEKGNDISSISDLRGKKIFATGKGSTPEYTLRTILEENGIDPDRDVVIEFKSEPSEIVALMTQADNCIAMLPQPYVTVAQSKIEGLRIAIDLTQAWKDLDNGSMLITGVIVGTKKFLDSNPETVSTFLKEYNDSINWVCSNIVKASALIEKNDIVKSSIAEKALPYCNLTCIRGYDMVSSLSGYLQTLLNQNPKSIGGKLPENDFYYVD